MKKIPMKNYFILSIILIISVIGVLYINHWFLNAKKQNVGNNIMNFIKELKVTEIDNYITENPNFIIYLKANNSDNNKFEKKLKKFLIDYDLQKEFVYINLDDFNIKSYTNFIDKYKEINVSTNLNEAIIIIENQKIIDILYKEKNFDVKKVKSFLKENGVY